MRLILIRHGKAEQREGAGASAEADAERALTREGKRKMRQAAAGLRRIYPKIDLLASSPLRRAAETAEILYAAYADAPQFLELDLLADAHSPRELMAWLKAHDLDASSVAIVGHEPTLSRWAGFFLTGKEASIVRLKKGAACVLEFNGTPAGGKGLLVGLYQPADLRMIR